MAIKVKLPLKDEGRCESCAERERQRERERERERERAEKLAIARR